MDLSSISVSKHALDRFQQRWLKVESSTPKDWETTFRKLLSNVDEIKKKPAANVGALIRYKRRARYFHNSSGWIFVTDEELTVVFTIERRKDCPEMWEKSRR